MALGDETGKKFQTPRPIHANGKGPASNGAPPVTTNHVKRSRDKKKKKDRIPHTEQTRPAKKQRFDVVVPTPLVLAYDQFQRMVGTTLGLPPTMRLSSDNDGPKSTVRLRWMNYLTIHIDLTTVETPSRNGSQTSIVILQINGQLRPGGGREEQRDEAYRWRDLLAERSTPRGEGEPLEGFYANWTEGQGTVPGELKFEVKGEALEYMRESA